MRPPPARPAAPRSRYNDGVKRTLRLLFACLLAVAVPLQAGAIAFAQASASSGLPGPHSHHHVHDDGDAQDHGSHDTGPADPCDEPGGGGLIKCCHSHAVWVDVATNLVALIPPTFERDWFVARWTSFIPEDPSPPPIASFRAA